MKNVYYVYIYLDQRKPGKWTYKDKVFNFEPFYIGKGRNNREIQHLMPFSLKILNAKNSKIKAIIEETEEQPIHYRIYENLSNEEAVFIEIDMIKHFGRKDINTGILCNHTDGGDGTINRQRKESEKEKRRLKRRKIYQYDIDGNLIKKWESAMEAENNNCNFKRNGIMRAARGTRKMYNGFIWSYKDLGEKINAHKHRYIEGSYKNIKQVDISTGKVIRIFQDIYEIQKFFNLDKRDYIVCNCIAGNRKSAHGYFWSIKEEKDIIVPKNHTQNKYIKRNPNTKEIIAIYETKEDAAKKEGFSKNYVYTHCRYNKIDKNGFIWEVSSGNYL
jgi:hypothetical protein